MFQRFSAIGFLGMDPKVKDLPSGQKLASFTVATSRRFKDKTGQRVSETEWHPCVCFGKLADIAALYLVKGKKVQVEGRLHTRNYIKTVGGEEVKMFYTEIILSNFIMLDARERNDTPADEHLPEPEDFTDEVDPLLPE